MMTVRICARHLQWPDSCACCLGRATTRLVIGQPDTDGGGPPGGWRVPYCEDCLLHARANREHDDLLAEEEGRGPLAYSASWAFLLTGGLVLLLVIGVGVPLGILWDSNAFLATTFALALAFGAMFTFATVFAWLRERRQAARDHEDAVERDAARERYLRHTAAVARAGRNCVCSDPAVTHLECRGDFHTLEFARDDYAREFIALNRKRVLI